MIREIRNKIVEIAYSYEGKKELKGNSGFEDDFHQQELEAVGWKKGWSWCVFQAKLIWCKTYGHFDSSIIAELEKLFVPNAVQTWENFKKSKKFKTGNNAEEGDLALFALYKNDKPVKNGMWTQGHAGIVTKHAQLFFLDMEGNTNGSGGREGIEVAEMKREYPFYEENGLRLLGFVKPKTV